MVNVRLLLPALWGRMPSMKSWPLVLALIAALVAPAAAGQVVLPRLKPGQVVLPRMKPTPPASNPEPAEIVPDAPATPKARPLAIRFPGGSGNWDAATVAAAQKDCRSRLAGLDIDFEPLAPIGQDGGCGTPGAILIRSMGGVRIDPPAEANCALAEALHAWVVWSVKPAAAEHLNKTLTVVHNASAYACRRRNNASSGKLSEHAKANALDVSTLGFSDGASTNIKGDWSGLRQLVGLGGKSAFLQRIRRDACIRFTTVLGPGTDPYHGDHFHIDLARRRNGYRICQ